MAEKIHVAYPICGAPLFSETFHEIGCPLPCAWTLRDDGRDVGCWPYFAAQSHSGHPRTIMNLSLANGPLVALIAAVVLLVGVSGTGTKGFSSPNSDHDHSGLATPSVTDKQVLRNNATLAHHASAGPSANEPPRWRSDIMDSYESVPSLAALSKPGHTHVRRAPDAPERRAALPTGISP